MTHHCQPHREWTMHCWQPCYKWAKHCSFWSHSFYRKVWKYKKRFSCQLPIFFILLPWVHIIFFMFIHIFSYHVTILSTELYCWYVWCQHLVCSIAHLFPVFEIHAYFSVFLVGEHLKWVKKVCVVVHQMGQDFLIPRKNVNAAADNDAFGCLSEMTEELCLDMHKIIMYATCKFYF